MDRLIRTAWRAFWVGLGASAVLVTQTVLTPPSAAPIPAEPAAAPLFAPSDPPAAVRTHKTTDPILSKVRDCETIANVTRCS